MNNDVIIYQIELEPIGLCHLEIYMIYKYYTDLVSHYMLNVLESSLEEVVIVGCRFTFHLISHIVYVYYSCWAV